jgi:glycosyltransferase involved in cell wall biosynthesis
VNITIVLGPFQQMPPSGHGAVEKVWWDFAQAFADRGHAVRIVGKAPDDAPSCAPRGVDVVAVRGFRATRWLPFNLLLDLLHALSLRRHARGCDVLVTNSFCAPLVMPHPETCAMIVHIARFPKGQMRLYGRADALQAVSTPVADEIARQAPGLRRMVTVLPNPVDTRVFRPPPRREPTGTIVYAGRIHPEKGIDLLIQAFRGVHARRRHSSLRLIGPVALERGGGGESYLRRLRASAAGLPVDFAGAVGDPHELNAQYARADCFCYPSLAERGEAFGLAILEAMAAGLPVVVSELSCFHDFVTHGREGFFFDHRAPDPADRIADSLLQLLADSPLAARMGENAAARASEFDLQTLAGRYLDYFAAVHARRQAGAQC